MKNKIEFKAQVIDGKINYIDDNYNKKLLKFKDENEGEKVMVTIEAYESPLYFQHKYYRGYLLPDITKAYGEHDTEYVHRFELKKDFAMIPIENTSEIPAKYKDKCVIYVKEINVGGEVKTTVIGYSKSCADMTYEEMKEFIIKCEHRLFVDLESHIGVDKNGSELTDYQNMAKLIRADAMSGDKELFADETTEIESFENTEKGLF